MKEGIRKLWDAVERYVEPNMKRFFGEDREDVKLFLEDLQAKGFSAGRVMGYPYVLVSVTSKSRSLLKL